MVLYNTSGVISDGAWGGMVSSVTICRRASIEWDERTLSLYHDLEGNSGNTICSPYRKDKTTGLAWRILEFGEGLMTSSLC